MFSLTLLLCAVCSVSRLYCLAFLITQRKPQRQSSTAAGASETLANTCDGTEKLKVAAIINWYGISDVADLLSGPDRKSCAVMWMGSQTDAATTAKRVSPLSYVRAGLPPILSIHGSADPVVPFDQSVRLHQALGAASVPDELVTIKGGVHGQFTDAELEDVYPKIYAFLYAHGLR